MKFQHFLQFVLLSTCVISNSFSTDLLEVYQDALGNDPSYRAAEANFLSNEENVYKQFATLLPQLSLSADTAYSHIRHDNVSLLTDTQVPINTHTKSRNYTATLTQKIFDFGNIASLSSAQAGAKAATAIFAGETQGLIRRTTAAYFNVLEKQDLVRFSKASVDALKRQHEQTRARYQVGLDTITDVYQVQARYEAIKAKLIANQNALLDAKESLHEITGKYYDTLNALQVDFNLKKPEPDNLDLWTQKATQHNFSNIAYQFNTQAQHQLVKQAFAGHLPSLNFTGTYSDTRTNYKNIEPIDKDRETRGELALSIPIFSGGEINANTKQAQYNYQKALALQEENQRTVVAKTHRDYNDILASISQATADKRSVKANISALKGAKAELKVGTKTLLDVLTQQENLLNAQSEEARDLYAYLNGLIKLEEDVGELSIAHLKTINAWLQPTHAAPKT